MRPLLIGVTLGRPGEQQTSSSIALSGSGELIHDAGVVPANPMLVETAAHVSRPRLSEVGGLALAPQDGRKGSKAETSPECACSPPPCSECYDGLVSTNRPARALATSQDLLTWSG